MITRIIKSDFGKFLVSSILILLINESTEIIYSEEEQVTNEGITVNPASVSSLVNYQEGSVVSRTLIDKNVGTVTLFAFAQGQGLSEHTAPYDAMVYIIDGEADISIAGKAFHLNNGDMIIMPATQPHALKANKQFKMMLVMIKAQS
jgi:quercetin dioxygenase-like cupin family protein